MIEERIEETEHIENHENNPGNDENDMCSNFDIPHMCKYICCKKHYSEIDLRDKKNVNVTELAKTLIPVETECFYCKEALSSPQPVLRKARLITLNQVYSGFTTYNKYCPSCKIRYRYQESKDGIHNFDDVLLLGFDVFQFLLGHVMQNNSINSFIESLENVIDIRLNQHKISNAYILFEILSTPEQYFKCSICGDHPWALVTDVNRKIAFKCPMEDVEAEEIEEEFNGEVDCDKFWEDLK